MNAVTAIGKKRTRTNVVKTLSQSLRYHHTEVEDEHVDELYENESEETRQVCNEDPIES